MLYLYGESSAPALCFSLVLVMSDNHEHGRTFGTEPKEWFVKEITGILLTMELERLIAVLGLAYKLPYVPDNNTRREQDLLHLTMIDNAFCFATTMMSKSGAFYVSFYLHHLDWLSQSITATPGLLPSPPVRARPGKIFLPQQAQLFQEGFPLQVPLHASRRSVRPIPVRYFYFIFLLTNRSAIVPIYDGMTRQLKVPNELRNIPNLLPRYIGTIPEYSLALVAYTVSMYSATFGVRKDQVTTPFHIHFVVVLHEPVVESDDDAKSSGDAQEVQSD